jgi:hypothetical protein
MSKIDGKIGQGVQTLQALDSDPKLVHSLRALGNVLNNKNTVDVRRGLRGGIERQSLENSKEVLTVLQGIQKLLDQVGHDVSAIRGCCDDLEQQLRETKSAAGSLTTRAAELKAARLENEQKIQISERFVATFTLRPEEAAVLASGEINESFFSALARVHSIASSAKLLLRSASAQQAGLDILDRMGDTADAAYDKITVFAQQQFLHFSVESPEPPVLLRTALELLGRERPSLMKYCVEEIEQVRKQALVAAFVRALTVGGPGGSPAPIDATCADDVVRYVSNILAWFHQVAWCFFW